MKQSTNLELNEPVFGVGMNVKKLTHSQQHPQGPKTHKKEPTIRQAIRTVFWAPQRSLPYRFLVLDEVKCNAHTQQSTSSSESLRPVNLTENAQRHFQRLLVWLL